MARTRETIQQRVEQAKAMPRYSDDDLVADGAMTLDVAAAFGGLSEASLRRAMEAGHLPYVRFRSDGATRDRILVPRVALREFLRVRLTRRDGVCPTCGADARKTLPAPGEAA